MPKLRNRTAQDLELHRIGRSIKAGETIEVTDTEAAALAGHPLLDDPDRPVEAKDEPEASSGRRRARSAGTDDKEGAE